MSWPAIDATHDSARGSWVEGADDHPDFPVQNLPYGIFSCGDGSPRLGVAIGDMILDLAAAAEAGLLPKAVRSVCRKPSLNALFTLPAADRLVLRARISELLSDRAHHKVVTPLLHPAEGCTLHLPAEIGDYTDFYVGIHHATNVGKLFRPDTPLLPNYKHVPIGYHGRASSVRPSGVPVVRPNGQRGEGDYGPVRRLDYELELGVWIGRGNALGALVPIAEAPDHVAGMCLLNDWSARDIQAWEYQPLGPFLSKSFHSTISPWVVTAEAMAPFRIAPQRRPEGDPAPLPYLDDVDDRCRGGLALDLEVSILTARMRDWGLSPHVLGQSHASDMYWTIAQIVTHHASNGCNLRPGDLLGTGTISGVGLDNCGSLLEATQGGKVPIQLPTGETRTFLEDGDEVILSARAVAEGFVPIGFGPCRAQIRPAP